MGQLFSKIFIFILILSFAGSLSSYGKCSYDKTVKPVFVKNRKSFRDGFIKKNGPFKTYQKISEFKKNLCKMSLTANRSFKSSNMYSFIVTKKCQVIGSLIASSGAKVKHVALTGDMEIVGGGEINCTKNQEFKITNSSSQYCFPIQPISELIKQLIDSNVPSTKIYIKFKQKKFCTIKKDRQLKYSQIISGKYLDFGYKKNHIYNGDEFLKKVTPSK